MNREWKWSSKNGRAYFNAGIGQQSAAGTPHPGQDIPLGEGARLLVTKGVDRWWKLLTAAAFLRALTRGKRKKRRKHR